MFKLQLNNSELEQKLENQINQCFQHTIGEELKNWAQIKCREIFEKKILEAVQEELSERSARDEIQSVLKEIRSGHYNVSLTFEKKRL